MLYYKAKVYLFDLHTGLNVIILLFLFTCFCGARVKLGFYPALQHRTASYSTLQHRIYGWGQPDWRFLLVHVDQDIDQTEVFYWSTVEVRLTFSSRPLMWNTFWRRQNIQGWVYISALLNMSHGFDRQTRWGQTNRLLLKNLINIATNFKSQIFQLKDCHRSFFVVS